MATDIELARLSSNVYLNDGQENNEEKNRLLPPSGWDTYPGSSQQAFKAWMEQNYPGQSPNLNYQFFNYDSYARAYQGPNNEKP